LIQGLAANVWDRQGFCGREWTKDALDEGRAENSVFIRNYFNFLETTLLADDRDWVLKTEKPTLADIEGESVIHYVIVPFNSTILSEWLCRWL